MLKGFVSGEEKDIVRIPMNGRNMMPAGEKKTVSSSGITFESDGEGRYHVYGTATGEATAKFNLARGFITPISVSNGGQGTLSFFNNQKIDKVTFSFNNNKSTVDCWVMSPLQRTNASYNVIGNKYVDNIILRVPSGVQVDMLITPEFTNDGVLPTEFTPHYQEGWEVRDNQDRLIWGREDELQTATGTLPFKGYSLPVKPKSLLGNAVQNGTPSPQNIIMPEFVGARTGNLFDVSLLANNMQLDNTTGLPVSYPGRIASPNPVDVSQYSTVTISYVTATTIKAMYTIFSNNVLVERAIAVSSGTAIDVSNADKMYVCFYSTWGGNIDTSSVSDIMLNSGSTALPYEPYGWKVPFENHGENLFPQGSLTGKTTIVRAAFNEVASSIAFSNSQYTLSMNVATESAVGIFKLCFTYTDDSQDKSVWITNATQSVVLVSNAAKIVKSISITDYNMYVDVTLSNIMLTPGSEAKPYSPYLNETLPVYLGEVPTVRRIRKLVLTGTEAWNYSSSSQAHWIANVPNDYNNMTYGIITTLCTHYRCIENNTGLSSMINGDLRLYAHSTSPSTHELYIKDDAHTTTADFKAYLASQYAAGHPVTIWYVLANEQTGIVNEPLCKISTYSDELTTVQAHGLSAPLYGIGSYKDTLNLSTGVVTRKVKKLVLDGTEAWSKAGSGVSTFYYTNVQTPMQSSSAVCSHFELAMFSSSNYIRIYDRTEAFQDVAAFKSFLQQQYQAGTPVTIWYVLNTPTTETVTVPTGMTGEIEGYLTQVSTPTPTNRSVPKWNGVEETGGTYAVTVYTPPEIPTTTGQNTLTVDSNLAPSKLEVSIHAKKIHYGFKIDKSNDNSESAVIYTHDAVTMTPAYMDFTNDRFDYGSWSNAFFVRDCYPVALNLDGTIAYRLDPDDYTKKTDGTASDIFYELLSTEPSDWSTQWKQYYTKSGDEYILNSQNSSPTFETDTYYKLTYNSSFTGNFMMAFPKVWFYRHEDSQYNYVEISNHRLSDDWKCYAHINTSGQEVDFIYLPLFKGVIKDSKLRSIPGRIPQGGTTATTEVNAAAALGSRWQIWDHSSVELINDLLTLMSKSIDSQGRFGNGRESGYNSSDTVTYGKLQTGTLIKGGKFHGFSSSYKEVKVFGIEGFWANRWDRLQGMLLVNNVWKIKMTPPYNFTGTDFVTLSNASVPTGNGYLSKVQTSEYGSIPASVDGGSSTKYFKDYFYKTATDTRVAIRGGDCYSGAACGFRYVYVRNTASSSFWNIGASPVYK